MRDEDGSRSIDVGAQYKAYLDGKRFVVSNTTECQ